MNSPAEQIKERLSIEEVVSSYIKLEKAGANLKARCPFHNEKTPSFFVSPSRGSYYCFGCGASGDIFSFVEEFEGLDFKGALKLLAERAGVQIEYKSKKEVSEKERLYDAVAAASEVFEENLNKEVIEYLTERGLDGKTIEDFQVGYAKDDWRELYNSLKKKGFSDTELEKAGLVIKSEKGYYDRFRGRVMFPIADSSGRIIAFSGRVFRGDEKTAKYVNSPETPIFQKSAVLYGLDRAKESIRKNNFSILVEGQMDLLLAHQAGYRNTVATSGTALSDTEVSKENVVTNLGLIRRLSENIVLAFDGDKAGLNASLRAGKIALSLGMDVKVADMPEGVDPADLISKKGVNAWKEAIKNSQHVIEFLLNRILKTTNDPRKAAREIREKVLPFVASIESSIEKAHFVKVISERAGVPEAALGEDLKKAEEDLKYNKEERVGGKTSPSQMFRKDYILRRILGIILWQKTIKDKAVDVSRLSKNIENILGNKIEKIIENRGESKEDLIFEAEVFYGNGADVEKDTEELLFNLKEEILKEDLGRKMKELYEGKNKDSPELLRAIKELNEEIENLKIKRQK